MVGTCEPLVNLFSPSTEINGASSVAVGSTGPG